MRLLSPNSQVGFVDMFAREAFSCWTQFARLPQVLKQLESVSRLPLVLIQLAKVIERYQRTKRITRHLNKARSSFIFQIIKSLPFVELRAMAKYGGRLDARP